MALGLHYSSRMRDIVLPQAIGISLPATIGYLGTAAHQGHYVARPPSSVSSNSPAPVNRIEPDLPAVAGSRVVGVMYFMLCWPPSWWGSRMEARLPPWPVQR